MADSDATWDETLLAQGKYGEWFWKGLGDYAQKYIRGVDVTERYNRTLRCTVCKEVKYLGDFNLTSRSRGDHAECNKCVLNKKRSHMIVRRFEDTLPKDWDSQAACLDADPVVFFPDGQADYKKPDAKWRQYCLSCPVKDLCEQFAINSQSVGVFGGKFFTYKGNSIITVDGTTAKGRGRPKKAA